MNTPHERLGLARKASGYHTAKDFAQAHEINYSTYRAHESGKNAISQSAAEHYASLLKIKPEWLLYGIETSSDSLEKLIRGATDHTKAAVNERRRKTQVLFAQVMEEILTSLNIELLHFGQPTMINIKALVKETDNIVEDLMQKVPDDEEQEAAILRCISMMQPYLEKEILKK